MEFCPKCGSRLEPKKSKNGKEASLILVCPKDGYKKEPGKKVEAGKGRQNHPAHSAAACGCNRQGRAEVANAPYREDRVSEMR